MPERLISLGERARARGLPSLADAISATGGIAVALGVLLITIDIRADQGGRAAEAGLFAALVLAGYLVVLLMPAEAHAAGVSAIVLGIPGALGWAVLPGAHTIGDVRPFLVLTIGLWIVAFVAPRIGGRTIFIAAAALFLWLWIVGEVAGTDAYSAAPVPSPPAHTLFSLQSYARGRSSVELGTLDPNNPLYPMAVQCGEGNAAACNALYQGAPAGSDFRSFAATCGNTQPNTDRAGICDTSGTDPFGTSPFGTSPAISPIGPLTSGTSGKALDIGLVSAFFGIAYLGALYALDRGGRRGLATAFVVPGVVALVTGTQSFGQAAHHAWVGGALTFAAGILIGVVGDRTGRRFTTWAGAATVALGALIVALDAGHISHAVGNGNVRLAGPGMIIASFGVALVATAYIVAQLLGRPRPGVAPGGFPGAPPTPSGFGAAVPDAPLSPTPAAGAPSWHQPPPSEAPPWGSPPAPDPGPSWPPTGD